jgi:Tol biopolymer transport system component
MDAIRLKIAETTLLRGGPTMLRRWPLALALGLLACGDDGSTEPTDGFIDVIVTTTGAALDPDGYTVFVDEAGQAIGINDEMSVNGVTPGDHTVRLDDVADNCTVAGDNPRTITVAPGTPTEVDFNVSCAPALTGRLAFESARTGDFEVFSMNPDGTDVVNLTQNPAADIEPDWSPDGTRIAFVSDRDGNNEIYLMNADGTNQVRLTSSLAADENPDWSPDGNSIAYVSDRDGNREIYVLASDGSSVVRLTNNPAVDEHPAWSPDGSRIAFQAERGAVGDFEVFVMNADGTDPVNISVNAPEFDGRPAWSPDGTRIAFTSARDGGNFEIYVMNADGSEPERLTESDDIDSYPEWSPDGGYLAFRSDRVGNAEVFVMLGDGTVPVNRTNNPATDCHPSWTAAAGAGAASIRPPAPRVSQRPAPSATPRAGARLGLEGCR